jgi:8-oxo-dGTP pyrophosphatase MutT (NUDIX family)
MTGDDPIAKPAPQAAADESLVDLRCSVVVTRSDEFLLIRRRNGAEHDWVLPGGRPRERESMQSCARREAFEETGLRVSPARCAFVGEVIDPASGTRTVELIFLARLDPGASGELTGEPGAEPAWVHMDRLPELRLRPPIAGFLPALARDARGTAPYLGNLWRADTSGRTFARTGEEDFSEPLEWGRGGAP